VEQNKSILLKKESCSIQPNPVEIHHIASNWTSFLKLMEGLNVEWTIGSNNLWCLKITISIVTLTISNTYASKKFLEIFNNKNKTPNIVNNNLSKDDKLEILLHGVKLSLLEKIKQARRSGYKYIPIVTDELTVFNKWNATILSIFTEMDNITREGIHLIVTWKSNSTSECILNMQEYNKYTSQLHDDYVSIVKN
jgi:hypothetical protein